jgi:hypothetical protein
MEEEVERCQFHADEVAIGHPAGRAWLESQAALPVLSNEEYK